MQLEELTWIRNPPGEAQKHSFSLCYPKSIYAILLGDEFLRHVSAGAYNWRRWRIGILDFSIADWMCTFDGNVQ